MVCAEADATRARVGKMLLIAREVLDVERSARVECGRCNVMPTCERAFMGVPAKSDEDPASTHMYARD
jgi:hypothetical protein